MKLDREKLISLLVWSILAILSATQHASIAKVVLTVFFIILISLCMTVIKRSALPYYQGYLVAFGAALLFSEWLLDSLPVNRLIEGFPEKLVSCLGQLFWCAVILIGSIWLQSRMKTGVVGYIINFGVPCMAFVVFFYINDISAQVILFYILYTVFFLYIELLSKMELRQTASGDIEDEKFSVVYPLFFSRAYLFTGVYFSLLMTLFSQFRDYISENGFLEYSMSVRLFEWYFTLLIMLVSVVAGVLVCFIHKRETVYAVPWAVIFAYVSIMSALTHYYTEYRVFLLLAWLVVSLLIIRGKPAITVSSVLDNRMIILLITAYVFCIVTIAAHKGYFVTALFAVFTAGVFLFMISKRKKKKRTWRDVSRLYVITGILASATAAIAMISQGRETYAYIVLGIASISFAIITVFSAYNLNTFPEGNRIKSWILAPFLTWVLFCIVIACKVK